jgi:Predicted AAA-ATPase
MISGMMSTNTIPAAIRTIVPAGATLSIAALPRLGRAVVTAVTHRPQRRQRHTVNTIRSTWSRTRSWSCHHHVATLTCASALKPHKTTHTAPNRINTATTLTASAITAATLTQRLRLSSSTRRYFSASHFDPSNIQSRVKMQHNDMPHVHDFAGFASASANGQAYVDKTMLIARMLLKHESILIARPPRWGKSLMLNTLEEMVRGNRHKFQHSDVIQRSHLLPDFHWTPHPVVHLNMSHIMFKTSPHRHAQLTPAYVEQNFRQQLIDMIHHIGDSHNMEIKENTLNGSLEELLEKLNDQTMHSPAVLIDNYDVPIVRMLRASGGIPTPAIRRMQAVLFALFKYLHDFNYLTRWLVICTTCPFDFMGPFMHMEGMADINQDSELVSVLGYTWPDIERAFDHQLDELQTLHGFADRTELRSEIEKWYGGYSYDGETTLFNPYDINHLMHSKDFRPYWASQAHLGWLSRIADRSNILAQEWEVTAYDSPSLHAPIKLDDIANNTPVNAESLLMHYGYLTIDRMEHTSWSVPSVVMRIPNHSVRHMLSSQMFLKLIGSHGHPHVSLQSTISASMRRALQEDNVVKFLHQVDSLSHSTRIFAGLDRATPLPPQAVQHHLRTRICGVSRLILPLEKPAGLHQSDALWMVSTPNYNNVLFFHIIMTSGPGAHMKQEAIDAQADEAIELDHARFLHTARLRRYNEFGRSKPCRIVSCVYTDQGQFVKATTLPTIYSPDNKTEPQTDRHYRISKSVP